jgi:hypothetical protein
LVGRASGTDLAAVAVEAELNALDSRVELIQALIPLGLEAVQELLAQEVTALAGARYQRGGGVPGYARWGGQDGSVYLADQKVAVRVPRVRDVRRDQEVPLSTYQGLRKPRRAEEAALRNALLNARRRASTADDRRDRLQCARCVPAARSR